MKKILIFLLLVPVYGISQSVTDGLVAHWSFNGNTDDQTGNENNGVNNGAILTTDHLGNDNGAYLFKGNGSYVQVDKTSSLLMSDNDFSMSIWVYFNSIISDVVILDDTENGNGRSGYNLRILQSTKKLRLVVGSDITLSSERTYKDSEFLFEENTWYHIVASWNNLSGSIDFYINGELDNGTYFDQNATGKTIINNDNLFIGADVYRSRWSLNGVIDEVRMYNRVLNTQEIKMLYAGIEPINRDCQNLFCDGENIGIGTSDTKGHKLAVAGDIIAEEVKVASQSDWPDFVFDEKYNLSSLTELENFILVKKHLPNIPTAKSVENKGYSLGEMDSKLLKKIEELTLYLIEQNKKTEQLFKEVQILKKENMELKRTIAD